MFRARHPHDDRLFENYMTARHGETVDPLVAEHLADCSACAARYAEMSHFMDDIASEATAEADAAFPPEHLRAQQQHILRRIEHVARPARVISFPGHQPAERLQPASPHIPSRWIAGAAAAGLFIGVAMGASIGWQRQAREDAPPLAAATPKAPARLNPATAGATGVSTDATGVTLAPETLNSDHQGDDAFLSDLEVVLERTQTRELRAIDALTPHVREVREVRYLR